jgi:hypothetical protein
MRTMDTEKIYQETFIVFEDIKSQEVYKAVVGCLNIAKKMRSPLHVAVFSKELEGQGGNKISDLVANDFPALSKYELQQLSAKVLDLMYINRCLNDVFNKEIDCDKSVIWGFPISELQNQINLGEKLIDESFNDKNQSDYGEIESLSKQKLSLSRIKNRLLCYCTNYVSEVQRSLSSSKENTSFLHSVQTDVHTYFETRCKQVNDKLLNASKLLQSGDEHDLSPALTSVRQAIQDAADYFYPPREGEVICKDGKPRNMGKEQYMNRLHEYVASLEKGDTSNALVLAEVELVRLFVEKTNKLACKGVHGTVSTYEARQCLVATYFLLHNICECASK